MTLVKGPRPWPIWVFAIYTIANAILMLLDSLANVAEEARKFEGILGGAISAADASIIFASALFSIRLIPLALVWIYASNIARLLILGTTLLLACIKVSVFLRLSQPEELIWAAAGSIGIPMVFTGLLFIPSVNRYFAQKEAVDAGTFE